jgi:hypothetical protein
MEEMKEQLAGLYLDTAATVASSMLMPALGMTGKRGEHIVYGSDCGVPCSNERILNANVESLLAFEGLTVEEKEADTTLVSSLVIFQRYSISIEALSPSPVLLQDHHHL